MKILIFKTVFLQSQTKRSETNCLNGMQTSWEVIWIHRAKEEFESEEGKEALKSLELKENMQKVRNVKIIGCIMLNKLASTI